MQKFKSPQAFMKNVNVLELTNRIKQFRSLDLQKMNEKELYEQIQQVLLFDGQCSFFSNYCTIEFGHLYRVRKISKLEQIEKSSEDDFWNPPPKFVEDYGRLNKPNESLLYTSRTRPIAAVQELKIKENNIFFLIVYRVTRNIQAIEIGGDYDFHYQNLGKSSENIILINETYNNFFRDEFCRDVGIGTEYLYKLSVAIARNIFSFPPSGEKFIDAMQYPSVCSKKDWNVCILPEKVKELLAVQSVMVVQYFGADRIIPIKIMQGYDKKGNAKFYNLKPDEKLKFSDSWWKDF